MTSRRLTAVNVSPPSGFTVPAPTRGAEALFGGLGRRFPRAFPSGDPIMCVELTARGYRLSDPILGEPPEDEIVRDADGVVQAQTPTPHGELQTLFQLASAMCAGSPDKTAPYDTVHMTGYPWADTGTAQLTLPFRIERVAGAVSRIVIPVSAPPGCGPPARYAAPPPPPAAVDLFHIYHESYTPNAVKGVRKWPKWVKALSR